MGFEMDYNMTEIQKQLEEHYRNTPIMFLKFGNNIQYLEQIREGSLYMNNFKYYIELEKKSGNAGMGDKLEVSYPMGISDISISNEETDELIVKVTAQSVDYRNTNALHKPLFCLYAVTADMLQVVEVNDDRVKCILKFTDKELESMKKAFGEHVLFIMAQPFLNKVKKAFKEKQYEVRGKLAIYADYSIHDEERFKNHIEGNSNLFFYKEKAFAHQKEYRIVILNKDIKEGSKEQIESLEADSAIFDIKILGRDKGISVSFYLPTPYQ